MKLKTLPILAFALAAPLVSFAQPRPDQEHGRDDNRRGAEQHRPPAPPPRVQQRDERHDERRDDRQEARGAGPDHNFRRGGRLPTNYRSHQYVVNDWRGHHLSAPPRGYQWVQTGADYVLVAVATGIIAQILLNQ